jgi:hypothetical protein
METLRYPSDDERSLPVSKEDVSEIVEMYEETDSPERSELFRMVNDVVRDIENDLGVVLDGELLKIHGDEDRTSMNIRLGSEIREQFDMRDQEYTKRTEESDFHHPVEYRVEVRDLRDSNAPIDHNYEVKHSFEIQSRMQDDYQNPLTWENIVEVYGEPSSMSQHRTKDFVEYEEEIK